MRHRLPERSRRGAAVTTALAAVLAFAAPGALAAPPQDGPAQAVPSANKVPWGTTAEGMAIKAYIKEYDAHLVDKIAPPQNNAPTKVVDPGDLAIHTPLSPGRNIAAFAYTETDDGPIRYAVAPNAPRLAVNGRPEKITLLVFDEDYNLVERVEIGALEDVHSEEIVDDWLAEKGIPTSRVYALETERQDCEKRCSIFLGSDPESKHGEYSTLRKNGGPRYNHGDDEKNRDSALQKERQSFRDKGYEIKKPKEEEAKAKKNLGVGCKTGSIGIPLGGGRTAVAAAYPMAGPCGGEEENDGVVKGLTGGGLGGVDFTTLQMRYLSDDAGSGGVKYAFSGRPTAPGTGGDLASGLDAVTSSTADLRTWLVLDPSRFWVNLNPDEPGRVIDPALGRTDAGKALLEADYLMKRTEGKLLDPKTDLGARYWDALLAGSDKACYSSRMWIVPGDVEVREDGSSLYILKADLAVKAKAQHIANAGKLSCVSDPASDARNEQLEQRMVVPAIVKAVNTAPEYAPIRRAFLARIVAQWIRKRHQDGHRTSFDKLIGSGNIGPAELQDGWTPRQVYDSYVRSIQNGDFSYTQTVDRGDMRVVRQLVTGGVDFSRIPMSPVGAERMKREHPDLPRTVRASAAGPASAADGSIWMGASAGTPDDGLWSRTSGTVRAFASGRDGIAVIIVVALAVVAFGVRGGSGRRRRAS
ncbi:hypothetical protein ACQPZ8_40100 [Actinomadura nitritigenes]|uniref:hypothetical protein n=1 Tax=Actinomadura nitritigenes TaxID=134602 RepID=UPI003D929FEB